MRFAETMLNRGGDLQVVLFFACLAIFLLLERLVPRRPRVRDVPRALSNWLLTALNVVALGFVPISFIAAAAWAERQGWGLFNAWEVSTFWVIAGTLLLRGFVSTFTHLLNHKIPWLWRLHRVHHLDTELDVSSTVRFHPLEMLVNPLIGLPIVVGFGLSPWVLAFYELLDVSITLFSHSNVRIPERLNRWLRYVIVTPDLHRIHHSSWQPETDSNYGAVFPLWDLVFGTFRAAPRDDHQSMQLGLEELRAPEANRFWALLRSPLRGRLVAEPPAPQPRPDESPGRPAAAD